MARVDVERDVGPEVVRNPVGVPFRIGHAIVSAIVVEAERDRDRTAGGIVHVHREAVAVGEGEVGHQLELVRLVVRGVVPRSMGDGFEPSVAHFLHLRA